MNEQEKMEALFEIFETEDFTSESALDALQWDSMAMLSVMALVKTNGKSVTGQQMREMKTVSDILAVL